jgi:hypothetical protein
MTMVREPRPDTGPVREPPDATPPTDERRRRRAWRFGGVGLAVVVVGVGIVAGEGGGGGHAGHHAASRPAVPKAAAPLVAAPKPPGVPLPSAALFTQIAVTANGLLLSGQTTATAQSKQPTCVSATVNPVSLALGPLQTGGCGDPLLYGQSVEAVNTPIAGTNNETLSIDAASPTTGQVSDGPTVMTYGSYSDTRPVIAQGTQWLWIYDVETTNGPELLQVSAQSGGVVDTIAMPELYRPLLAADDQGVWVANSQNESPAAPALSYVAAGASAPRVVESGPLPVCWLTASGTSAWVGAGLQGACAKETTERFGDAAPSAAYSTPGAALPLTVIGNEADGLWTFQWSPTGQQIVSIDPDTGSESVAATVPGVPQPEFTDQGLAPGQGVYFDGAIYLLEPPFRLDGYIGYSSLVRVVPAGRG